MKATTQDLRLDSYPVAPTFVHPAYQRMGQDNAHNPDAGHLCDLCGHWNHSLIDGICPECRTRLRLDHPNVLPPAPVAEPYSLSLALRVLAAEAELADECAIMQLATKLERALALVAEDLRRGERVHLHAVGSLIYGRHKGAPVLHAAPDPRLRGTDEAARHD